MTNIYKLRAQLLTEKYEPFFEDFKQYKDDRILVPNCRDQLLNACAAMETVSNNFVRVAFNKAFNEQEALMESIVTRFTGKVWRDLKWRDAE